MPKVPTCLFCTAKTRLNNLIRAASAVCDRRTRQPLLQLLQYSIGYLERFVVCLIDGLYQSNMPK